MLVPQPIRRARKVAAIGRQFARGRRFGQQLSEGVPSGDVSPTQLEAYFDALSEGPGVWKWRHYFDVYDRHFRKFVGRPVTVLEIGVYSGGSIEMWRSYLGPQARIIGVDIEPACTAYERPGVDIVIGDQGDPEFWSSFLPDLDGIDIVIDDGGHLFGQQITTLEALLPRLNPGGVYVCEDVHGEGNVFHAYMGGLQGNLHHWAQQEVGTDSVHETTPFQSSVHSVHVYPYVWVIEKNESRVDRLVAAKRGSRWQPFLEGIRVPGDGSGSAAPGASR